MRRRRILITGAAGRFGSDLVRALAADHELVQFDLVEPKDPEQRKIGRTIVGSINDRAAVDQAMDGVDTVIHLAAFPGDIPNRYKLIETNVLGTFSILEAAGHQSRVEQFIYMSSVCWHGITDMPGKAYWPHRLPFDETHPSLAIRYYSCTKVQGEFWCRKYVERFHKPVVAVRPAWIIPLKMQARMTVCSAPGHSVLCDYVGTSDLVDGFGRLMDYAPKDGFDRFLFHAPDQTTNIPSLDLAAKYFPEVPVDREKLQACEGFGAFVDCSYAGEKLGWTARYRCTR